MLHLGDGISTGIWSARSSDWKCGLVQRWKGARGEKQCQPYHCTPTGGKIDTSGFIVMEEEGVGLEEGNGVSPPGYRAVADPRDGGKAVATKVHRYKAR